MKFHVSFCFGIHDPLTIDIPPQIAPERGDPVAPDDFEQFGDDDFEAITNQQVE